MAIGYSVDKLAIDARVGANVVALRNALEDALRIKQWLDETSDATLLALGYVQEDVNLARASYTALEALYEVAIGQRTVPVADNFFFFARRLGGVQ